MSMLKAAKLAGRIIKMKMELLRENDSEEKKKLVNEIEILKAEMIKEERKAE